MSFFSEQLSPRKRAFLSGTLLLTAAGFSCRILGFFYRIFLSRTIGAEGLGIYNMVHPVYGICFALCAGSIQSALSQYIASNERKGRTVFRTGLLLSLSLSLFFAFLICRYADWIARTVLMEPSCAPYLPLMGLSVPFASAHACINGYYYGMQKARVPAFSQIAEQILRMIFVFSLASLWTSQGIALTVQLAVLGHVAGEVASALFTLLCLMVCPPSAKSSSKSGAQSDLQSPLPSQLNEDFDSFSACALPLIALALPLMGNRLVLNLLASAEAVWIPASLKLSGLPASEAFSVYGVLTGMALPFILFPSAITNSMAVLLLPSVARAQAEGRNDLIDTTVSMSLRYSMYMGIFCIGVFVLFGNALGTSVFHSQDAGTCIQILAWLCPFLYLATTIGSILNGLGKTHTTFLQSSLVLMLRLVFVLIGIPRFGIYAYLCGMLVCELLLALLHLHALHRIVPFHWNAISMIVKPVFVLLLCTGIHLFAVSCLSHLPSQTQLFGQIPLFFVTALQIFGFSLCYGGLLLLFHHRRNPVTP
ncbi:oligosaccharide flippase family protein [Brotaphodocola sp.]|uniref:oligosaccharide flippase family protein n=1 Tax=Brotaphodocola sp. TaxID=3073577 RepID=UPI003D7D3755